METASETLTFRWLKNKEEITNSAEVQVKNDDNFSVLSIESIQSNSTGNYTCLARNIMGESRYSAVLQVEGKLLVYSKTHFKNC